MHVGLEFLFCELQCSVVVAVSGCAEVTNGVVAFVAVGVRIRVLIFLFFMFVFIRINGLGRAEVAQGYESLLQ